MTVKTRQGDTFDVVAYRELGDCRYTGALMDANRGRLEVLIFSAGEELELPEVATETSAAYVPAWLRT